MNASTHDGRFHADEIFALAVLNIVFPGLEIVRSRDEKVYKNVDIIVDVSHVYDAENHSLEGADKLAAIALEN